MKKKPIALRGPDLVGSKPGAGDGKIDLKRSKKGGKKVGRKKKYDPLDITSGFACPTS